MKLVELITESRVDVVEIPVQLIDLFHPSNEGKPYYANEFLASLFGPLADIDMFDAVSVFSSGDRKMLDTYAKIQKNGKWSGRINLVERIPMRKVNKRYFVDRTKLAKVVMRAIEHARKHSS